jgi:hypothetical protein
MFTLTTMYWIASVIFTFLKFDLWNKTVTTCYGNPNTLSCIEREEDTNHIVLTTHWLEMFYDILFVNVSTVPYRVPASYADLIRKHLSQLTRLPEF